MGLSGSSSHSSTGRVLPAHGKGRASPLRRGDSPALKESVARPADLRHHLAAGNPGRQFIDLERGLFLAAHASSSVPSSRDLSDPLDVLARRHLAVPRLVYCVVFGVLAQGHQLRDRGVYQAIQRLELVPKTPKPR